MPKNKTEIIKEVEQIEGWLNPPVVDLLYRLCKSLSANPIIVEIGSWKAKSSVLLAHSSAPGGLVYAIDPHVGSHEHREMYGQIDTFKEFEENLKYFEVRDQVKVIRKFSKDAIGDIPSSFDLLWIDGSHDYKDIKNDFDLYYPKLKVGGWVAWHDYKWQGVKRFTWELLGTKGFSYVLRVEDTHYFKKNAKPNKLYDSINRIRLCYYQLLQFTKRNKRKIKKRLKKIKSD